MEVRPCCPPWTSAPPAGRRIAGPSLLSSFLAEDPPASTALHRHPEFQFVLILEGEGTLALERESLAARAGDILFVPGQTAHALLGAREGLDGPFRRLVFHIHGALMRELGPPASPVAAPPEPWLPLRVPREAPQADPIKALLRDLHGTLARGGNTYPHLFKARARALEVAFHLCSFRDSQGTGTATPAGFSSKRSRMHPVLDLIEANLHRPLRASELARSMHLSLYHFLHLFKEATGDSVGRYVTRLRVEKARELLEKEAWDLEAIAGKVGLTSKALAYHFKKRFQVPPSRFRKVAPGPTGPG